MPLGYQDHQTQSLMTLENSLGQIFPDSHYGIFNVCTRHHNPLYSYTSSNILILPRPNKCSAATQLLFFTVSKIMVYVVKEYKKICKLSF